MKQVLQTYQSMEQQSDRKLQTTIKSETDNFKAFNGWLDRFMKYHGPPYGYMCMDRVLS